MALPLSYSWRNLVVRKSSTLLTALGVGMTVAVFAGVGSLNAGFRQVYEIQGDENLGVYLRQGAISEGESAFQRERVEVILKERPEIVRKPDGQPYAAAETFLAVYMDKIDGGVTNVPIRGIQPMSLELHGDALEVVAGRPLRFGADEVMVGRPLTERMRNCQIGDLLVLNMTPFKVAGVYELDTAQGGEVWGDADRLMEALDRPVFQRVVARVKPGTDFEAVAEELKGDKRTPVNFMSEREYMAAQTSIFGGMLAGLGAILTVVMSIAAVLGSINTMIAAVASRTHEIGVLLAVGYRRIAIFLAFLIESTLIGLLGGVLGVLLVLPFDGLQTGAVNWSTFTDVSFSFEVTAPLLAGAVLLSLLLGVVGGVLPAIRAARLEPVEALREL